MNRSGLELERGSEMPNVSPPALPGAPAPARRVQRMRRLRGDDGSILPLVLGYATLAIVAIFVCVCATSLYLAQKRLDGLADAAALAGADGFSIALEGDAVRAELIDARVRDQANAIVDASAFAADAGATVVWAGTPDGVSARVTVSAVWHPPLVAMLVPAGVRLESTATSRTVLE